MTRKKSRRSPTSTSCRAALAGVLAVLNLGAISASAQTPQEQARILFREANQLFARKMYLDALHKYRQARALYPSFKIDLNIGGTLDALGRRIEAAVYFERFLVQSATAPADIIAAARERLAQLRGKLARVKVSTLLEDASIVVDGVSVGTAPLDLPVYLEPGEHQLEARKPGEKPVSRSITVSSGQALTIDLSPVVTRPPASAPVRPAAAPSPPASAPVIAKEAPAAAEKPDPLLLERRRSKTLWAWTALGIGGAFAVAAGVLYGIGGTQVSSAYDRYSSARGSDAINSAWSDVETAEKKVIAGHVLAGAAAVGIGIAVYQFLSRPDLVEHRASALTVTPLAAGAALRGSF